MVGVGEICALLMASTMGAGTVVAVENVEPGGPNHAGPAPPAPQEAAYKPLHMVALRDCPAMMTQEANDGASVLPAYGGGSYEMEMLAHPGGFIPLVPEPSAWAMMIAGFGLVGLARRRVRKA